jgi:hypothetical protein
LLAIIAKLVDQGLLHVDQLVDDLHERRDRCGAGLVNLLEDLVVPETFLVAVDDLVVPDADTGVAVLEEPVGVVPQPRTGWCSPTAALQDSWSHPPEVEGVARAIIRCLEV